ncbi:hypothetical protein IAC76_07530 [Spirochaetes bacterium]|uniref:Uncharacterized protein n=1 Tax=Candidatus Scatousia excrementipullorum TaxID=2840936 RepID=A0A9D9DPF3_9BACT|nr:hypothetical protein [Candidatus Scatousia excrementipullorum]
MKTPQFVDDIFKYLSKKGTSFKDTVLKKYGEQPGTMLVHTGVLGWILSSLAQVAAVAFNDKIPAEQKVFLIPQEIADAATNIISFYAVTQSLKSLGSKLVKTGKLKNVKISKFLDSVDGLDKSKIGTWDFDITKLKGYKENIKTDFVDFKNGVDVYAGLAGSILSCNIITPIIRNKYASERQKDVLAKMNADKMKYLQAPRGISMSDYLQKVYVKHSDLKV